ncbi:MAG TPA: GNAT family N-acetyltransferase [Myxococcota bacterium]|nr:GNAT family N-acetyltransferase [Myxococcota bacterium]
MPGRIKKRHIALLGLFAALAVFTVFYLQNDQDEQSVFIRPYEEERDFQPLVRLMNDNKYWISENPEFSPEKMLITKTPSHSPEKKGQAKIDVVESHEATAGFVAYYKKSPEHGFIWLLGVDKEFRGRGFGEMLVSHALANLKRQGSSYVTLAVRAINKPAMSLYKKMGFVEQYREEDRGMVTLVRRNL